MTGLWRPDAELRIVDRLRRGGPEKPAEHAVAEWYLGDRMAVDVFESYERAVRTWQEGLRTGRFVSLDGDPRRAAVNPRQAVWMGML